MGRFGHSCFRCKLRIDSFCWFLSVQGYSKSAKIIAAASVATIKPPKNAINMVLFLFHWAVDGSESLGIFFPNAESFHQPLHLFVKSIVHFKTPSWKGFLPDLICESIGARVLPQDFRQIADCLVLGACERFQGGVIGAYSLSFVLYFLRGFMHDSP